jgi:hypothetical protein
MFWWKYGWNSKSNKESFSMHLLAIRNTQYVQLVEICVRSFLFWHPNSQITIHGDNMTLPRLNQIFKDLLNDQSKNFVLMDVNDDVKEPWQKTKMKLILSLKPNEIFMDADLRWNGVIPFQSRIPIFFSSEFQICEKSPYRQMIQLLQLTPSTEAIMRNVSFFSFGDFDVTESFKAEVWELWETYQNLLSSEIFGRDDRADLSRLIEQFLLSVFVPLKLGESLSLKKLDRHLDGEFVESCYFGATGFTF